MYIRAIATISPPEMVSVCSGGNLELACYVTESPVLEWRIVTSQVYRCGITSQGRTDTQMSFLTIGNSTFTFTRISDENNMPLVSRLLIIPANRGLNQTRVICEDSTNSVQSITTIIVTQDNPDDHSMSRHSNNSVCMLTE